jgi:hypothetical protein
MEILLLSLGSILSGSIIILFFAIVLKITGWLLNKIINWRL